MTQKSRLNNQEKTPRFSSPYKRISASVFDHILLGVLVYFSTKFLGLEVINLETVLSKECIVVTLYFYFFLTIIPHFVFSQSLGQFIVGIKVLNSRFERLSFLNCILRDLVLRPLILLMPHTFFSKGSKAIHDRIANSVVVELK